MTAPLGREDTVLVSGGGKGITAACAVALAERYRSRFLLMGRSPLEEEPDWAKGVEGEAALKRAAMEAMQAAGERPTPAALDRAVRAVLSAREIAATMAAIEAAGGRADYLRADVRDGDAVRAALAPYRDRITALVHGAGLLADKLIQRKSAADFERVVGVKVDGLANLLAGLDEKRLRAVVLFASVAGFYGNIGQADYAIANSILDQTAYRLRRTLPHARILALDWGPWEGGMVKPALRKRLQERGIPLIPIEAGTATLIEALERARPAAEGGEQVHYVIGGEMIAPPAPLPAQTVRIQRRLTLEANPFLRDHVIGGHAVLPTVCAAQWMIDAAEAVAPGYRFFAVRDYRVFKGIVFDESLAESYLAEITPATATAEGGTGPRFAVRILSKQANGRPRYHYAVEVELRRTLPPAPQLDPPLTEPRPGLPQTEDFYADGTLFHGPAFRGVEALLDFTPHSLLLRCRLPEVPPQQQGQFPVRTFNPFLTDVTLQSLLIWSKLTLGYGGLPLRIAGAEQFRTLPFDTPLYAAMEVVTADKRHLVANVAVLDATGRLYSRITGAEITLSPRLRALFAQNRLEDGV